MLYFISSCGGGGGRKTSLELPTSLYHGVCTNRCIPQASGCGTRKVHSTRPYPHARTCTPVHTWAHRRTHARTHARSPALSYTHAHTHDLVGGRPRSEKGLEARASWRFPLFRPQDGGFDPAAGASASEETPVPPCTGLAAGEAGDRYVKLMEAFSTEWRVGPGKAAETPSPQDFVRGAVAGRLPRVGRGGLGWTRGPSSPTPAFP